MVFYDLGVLLSLIRKMRSKENNTFAHSISNYTLKARGEHIGYQKALKEMEQHLRKGMW